MHLYKKENNFYGGSVVLRQQSQTVRLTKFTLHHAAVISLDQTACQLPQHLQGHSCHGSIARLACHAFPAALDQSLFTHCICRRSGDRR